MVTARAPALVVIIGSTQALGVVVALPGLLQTRQLPFELEDFLLQGKYLEAQHFVGVLELHLQVSNTLVKDGGVKNRW